MFCLSTEATVRNRMYAALSRVFADHLDPNRDDLSGLLGEFTDSAVEAFRRAEAADSELWSAHADFVDALRSLVSDGNRSLAAQREFVTLFLLPIGVHPYESVHRTPERLLKGEPWREVREFYRRCGLAVSEDEHHPEDHIAVELGFMSLCNSDEVTGELVALGDQLEFVREHLLSWVPELVESIDQHEDADFYRLAGRLLHSWLLLDHAWLMRQGSSSER